MDKKNLAEILCGPSATIREAMELLSRAKGQILIIVDEDKRLMGVLTDGDLRRAVLKDIPLSSEIRLVMNREPKKQYSSSKKEALKIMKEFSIKQVPVLDRKDRVRDVILWEEVINGGFKQPKLENLVFILAGGRGTRLEPFTSILPKPLIPIGDKPIIEIVMDQCRKNGLSRFIISLNYKSSMIKHYFAENNYNAEVMFVKEEKPLGTAGSLYLIKDQVKDPVIVTNCDILIDIDFADLLNYHRDNSCHITVVGAIKDFIIPYGIINQTKGELTSITEKPEYNMTVNAGIYVLEKEIIDLLEDNTYMDMPNLIMLAKEKDYKVGVYLCGSEFIDVGQWDEYKKALAHVSKR